MSKFILSNNINIVQQIIDDSCSAGFEVSGKINGQINYISFYKLSCKNCNFYAIGNDFISVVGTFIYKGKHGQEALLAIYEDFSANINAIRDKVIGNCAFIIKKGRSLYVFGEYYGLYDIYYYNKNGLFVISHDLFDLYKSVIGLKINKLNMLEHLALGVNYCGETFLDDVYRLQDNESLIINTSTGSLEKSTFKVDWKSNESISYDECVSKIASTLMSIGKTVFENFGTPALSSTGGLDNRLNLATFLAIGAKPELYYGVGNSGTTNTFPGDLKVNQEFEVKFGTKLNQVSWNNSTPIDRDWEELKSKYGFSSVCYGGAKDFFDAYERIPNSTILFGYMGELYRNLDVWENRKFKPMTLDEYIDKYLIDEFIQNGTKLFDEIVNIKNHLHEKLLEVCNKWNINPYMITANDDFFLNLERRRCSDIAILNLMNYHHNCCYIFAQHNVFQILANVDAIAKKQYKFQLDLLECIYPAVLSVPIFSHCRFQKYDSLNNTLSDYKSLYRFLKSIIPIGYRKKLKNLLPVSILSIFNNKYLDNKKNLENLFDIESNEAIKQILEKFGLIEDVDYKALVNGRLDRDVLKFAQELTIMRSSYGFKDY